MKINLPQTYFSKLLRAVVEFDMIADGDKILIGV
ncbi:MAG: tRNA 2-thiocytidine biosynthesis protein TtcA, partial [Selenomonas sp.]|nr:tRNA 2-thiocytidine biosynthesis protein TtcA [Selenomonas sp.]